MPSAPSVGALDNATPPAPAESVIVKAEEVNVEKSTVSPNVSTKVAGVVLRSSAAKVISGAVSSSFTVSIATASTNHFCSTRP